MSRRAAIATALAAVLLAGVSSVRAETSSGDLGAFDENRAGFSVKVRGETNPYDVFAVTALPGETLTVEVVSAGGPPAAGAFALETVSGTLTKERPGRWVWKAPAEHGLRTIRVRRAADGAAMTLHVFVLIPRDRVTKGTLNGYRIGSYPSTPLRGLAVYRPPRGFVEVTPENADTPLSPHFTLRQFLCKQAGGWPKYVVLRPRLLLKLEYLLKVVNEEGYRCDTFTVMSGYRTPFYNAAIKNVKYSRHQWGGAADIFIDESPKDGVMDDLNRDGRVDRKDADLLYELFDSLRSREEYGDYVGGLGLYGTTSSHGPFVHVDARGFRARWGR